MTEWSGDGWRVIHGDCLDVLPTLGKCDHVITDPPFTDVVSNGSRTNKDSGTAERVRGRVHGYVQPIGFGGIDGKESVYTNAMLEVCRRWCIAFCAFEQLGAYKAGSGASWVRAGVWRKPVPTPQFTGDRPGICGEALAIMHRPGRKRWNRGGCAAYWDNPKSAGDDRYGGHPTPKPVDLMVDLINAFTDPDELVVDPFCGSGTTGVACMRLNRRFIGIEKEAEYADLTRRRLEAEQHGSDLRRADAGQMPLFGGGA